MIRHAYKPYRDKNVYHYVRLLASSPRDRGIMGIVQRSTNHSSSRSGLADRVISEEIGVIVDFLADLYH